VKRGGALGPGYPSILDELGYGAPTGLVSIGGGCIAHAAVATFENGIRVFVKWAAENARPLTSAMFEREAGGLRALASAGVIRVPEVLAAGEKALALEMIETAPRKEDFAEDFGRRFAALHGCRGKTCGFPEDNFIGATPQFNEPVEGPWEMVDADDGRTWPEFFLRRRLQAQVCLAARNGHGCELEQLLEKAGPRILDELKAAIEIPSLLHGDLWSGNFIVDDRGEACLIDPAVYYGHREADLAMTRLFGGFEPSFYAAYAEALPLAPGHQERLAIYQLYHLLNHLNLFGGGYLERCRRILQLYAR